MRSNRNRLAIKDVDCLYTTLKIFSLEKQSYQQSIFYMSEGNIQDQNQKFIEVEPIDFNPRIDPMVNGRLNYFQDISIHELMRPPFFVETMRMLIPEVDLQQNQFLLMPEYSERADIKPVLGSNNQGMNQPLNNSALTTSVNVVQNRFQEQPSIVNVVQNGFQEQASFQSILCLRQEKKVQKKNQYNKNIVGHIISLVIKKILSHHYEAEVKTYCKHFKINYKKFCEYFKECEGQKKGKFGTSKLGKLFNRKNESMGVQKVFGMFMARYLKDEYVLYILSVGKMEHKDKYLECAGQLMYLPKIQKEQYSLMSLFQ